MNKLITHTLIVGACCCASSLAIADGGGREIELSGDSDTIALARRYIAAYQALDVERLESFYAADVRFIDPTSERTPLAQPFIFEGRDNVLAAIAQAAQSFVCIRYDVRRIYESSGHVVFAGKSQGLLKSEQGLFTGDGTIVTIITIKEGKVVEHRDYYDYAGGAFKKKALKRFDRLKQRICRTGAGLP